MIEIQGNLWEYFGTAIIAVTTNGLVAKSGKAVLGNGCAREAGERIPGLAARLGTLLTEQGNHVHDLGDGIVNFPVEHSPYENPDLRLIERSTKELVELADTKGWVMVVVPRPGCGGGGLFWKEVKPLLEKYLDDRFLVITQ
ncbi:MAG: ADP-ribose-binding protein [Deltaproteobacteria bacterium]|nr:ADP-ribose-binding protein [Deltaproteobacteria bacterium]TLN02577.1 MAG: macro domain-containing protein [bacterium]